MKEVNLIPDIPITLSMVIGDIVLRFGELERMLMTAHARIMGHGGLLDAIGELKEQSKRNTLGVLIKELKNDLRQTSTLGSILISSANSTICRTGLCTTALCNKWKVP